MPRARKNRISFQEEFFSDITVKDMLYGILVRSPSEKGMVTSVNPPELPTGYFLVTARDVPGSNLIDTPLGKVAIFSEGNISYKGEPVALLVGPDENVLQNLLSQTSINMDDNSLESYIEKENLDEIFSDTLLEKTLKSGACFEADENGNVLGLDSVFENAEHVVEGVWTYALKTPDYREPNGALCQFSGETLTVYTPTQWPVNLRKVLQEALNIKSENIVVKKTRSYNRGTSSIWYNSIIASQTAVASFKAKKPVKLVFSREEQECFMDAMLPVEIKHKTSCDKNGKITAMQVDILFDAGASNSFTNEIMERLIIASLGCYNPENMCVHAKAIRSPHPATSLDMHAIDSAGFFAVENQINLLTKKCALTPLEIRKINLPPKDKKIPLNIPFNFHLEKTSEVLEKLAETNLSDFNRKYASYILDEKDRKQEEALLSTSFASPRRGIGFSCAFEGSCYYGSTVFESSSQSLEVTLESEEKLIIHCSPVSASVQEIWCKLASQILAIPLSGVKINSQFTAEEEPPLPETIHSNISVMTALLKKCCEGIKRRKSGTKLPYTIKRGITNAQRKNWDSQKLSGTPFYSTSFASCVIEVELDPCTFREKIRRLTIIISGGKILNKRAAENSIKLGIQKVLSSLIEDDNVECENVRIYFFDSDQNPSQIGELVFQVIPSAYTQAVSQALGCTVNCLPLKSDSLYTLLSDMVKAKSQNENGENPL